jgi:hypothetical protein
MLKKKQHYVFRGYLKQWAPNGQIYYLREGQVFASSLEGIACERFFYRIEDLNQHELEFIEKVMIAPTVEPARTLQRSFLEYHTKASQLKKVVDGVHPALVRVIDEFIKNGTEDYHQQIEDNLLKYIDEMLVGKTGFYLDAGQAAKFIFALAMQFTRTKQLRETAVAQMGYEYHNCDTRRIMTVLSPLMAISLGLSLYRDRSQFKLFVIDNDTGTPFITGDQPIINIQAVHTGKPPEKLEFFYPLSPKRAMFMVESTSTRDDFAMSAISVNNYNMMIVKNSWEQVYSDSSEYLDSIKVAAILTGSD